MVSYEDLIYHFADIYLETAVKCSICKENYTRIDDNEFLDEFMRFFVSLLSDIEQNDELNIDDIDEILEERKDQTLNRFYLFMIHQIMKKFASKAYNELTDSEFSTHKIPEMYSGKITEMTNKFFKELDKKDPVEFLRTIREQEERLL